jgi:hypothetical protein
LSSIDCQRRHEEEQILRDIHHYSTEENAIKIRKSSDSIASSFLTKLKKILKQLLAVELKKIFDLFAHTKISLSLLKLGASKISHSAMLSYQQNTPTLQQTTRIVQSKKKIEDLFRME